MRSPEHSVIAPGDKGQRGDLFVNYAIFRPTALAHPSITDRDIRVLAAVGALSNCYPDRWPTARDIAGIIAKRPGDISGSLSRLESLRHIRSIIIKGEKLSRWGVLLDTPAAERQS